jgi:hypothetical protein
MEPSLESKTNYGPSRSVAEAIGRWLAEAIDRDAISLLKDFEKERGVKVMPPVPIDDLVEKHLKLSIELDDIHRLFDIDRAGSEPVILGAIFFDQSRIVIDESLDPEEHPGQECSYRFTLAHEAGGHWRWHQNLLGQVPLEHRHRHMHSTDPAQLSLFGWPQQPAVSFRSRVLHELVTNPPFYAEIESEADFYAYCLLMPSDLIFAAWEEMYPDCKRRVLGPITPEEGFVEVSCVPSSDDRSMNDEERLDRFCQPLSNRFLVSAAHMRDRLEGLGLLLRRTPPQRELFPGLWPPIVE